MKVSHNKIGKLSTLIHLVHACKIKHLVADNNGCIVDDCSLCSSSTLESLDLSFNFSSSKGVIELCNILLKHKNLKQLKLKGTPLCNESLFKLFMLSIQLENCDHIECDDSGFIASTMQQINKGVVQFDFDLDQILCFFEISNYINKANSKFINSILSISTLSLECDQEEQGKTIENFLDSSATAFDIFHFFSNLSMLNLSGIKLNSNVPKIVNML